LPPGDETGDEPNATGSPPVAKTIGMFESQFWPLCPRGAGGHGDHRDASLDQIGRQFRNSILPPSAQRNSIATFRPSTYPFRLKPLRNASGIWRSTAAKLLREKPDHRHRPAAARAPRAATQPPRRRAAVMNSRRLFDHLVGAGEKRRGISRSSAFAVLRLMTSS